MKLENQCFAWLYVRLLGAEKSPERSVLSLTLLCVLLLGSQPATAHPMVGPFTHALLSFL